MHPRAPGREAIPIQTFLKLMRFVGCITDRTASQALEEDPLQNLSFAKFIDTHCMAAVHTNKHNTHTSRWRFAAAYR